MSDKLYPEYGNAGHKFPRTTQEAFGPGAAIFVADCDDDEEVTGLESLMMEHTKEPWTFDQYGNVTVNGETVQTMGFALSGCKNSVANTSRIVACVNACKGFTTEGLEQCVSDGDTILNRLEGWQQDCMKAEQQRDELLVALKGIRDMIGYEWLREEFNEARDAIEKAEK